MTAVQREEIIRPATGLQVYQTDGVPGFRFDLNNIKKALLLPRIGRARLNSMNAQDVMLAYGPDSAALMVYGKAHLETLVRYMNPTLSNPSGSNL